MTRKEALLQIDRAMVRIRRSQTRRALGQLMAKRLKTPVDPVHSFVVDALDDAIGTGEEEPSVGTVAEGLGIDPSRASRMVASTVQAGYVKRVASQTDGRRTCLKLTGEGEKLLATIRRFRTQVFAGQVAGWSEHDTCEFAKLLTRFTDPRETLS